MQIFPQATLSWRALLRPSGEHGLSVAHVNFPGFTQARIWLKSHRLALPRKSMTTASKYSGATVGHEELAERVGVKPGSRIALQKRLDKLGIRYFTGDGGPWTTVDALNYALGINPRESRHTETKIRL